MRYTVLNRFQGSLLGAAIGEILGANSSDRNTNLANGTAFSSWLAVHEWGFQPLSTFGVGWGSLAMRQLRHLLQPDSLSDSPLKPDLLPDPDLLPESEPSLSGLAIATLPIALFYHENPDPMQVQIRQAMAQWQAHWQVQEQAPNPHQPAAESAIEAEPGIGVLLVSYTLSLILREQFSPATLIADFIRYFDLSQTDPLISQLDRLQSSESLLPVSDSPALLALAAFLKTPDSYRLSLLQAAQAQAQPSVVCAIAGALSGAYNGKAGLPLDWYSALQRRYLSTFESPSAESAPAQCESHPASSSPSAPDSERLSGDSSASASSKSFSFKPISGAESISPLRLLWGVESETQLLEGVNQLFASWSGMYHSKQRFQRLPSWVGSSVLAAPHVIRSL
jgi:ADP-ribosylglycohydrolase